MEELSPAVALPFRSVDNLMEITRIKLITDTASLLADPSAAAAEAGDMETDFPSEPRDLEIRTSNPDPASDGDDAAAAAAAATAEPSIGSPCSVMSDTSSIASAEDISSAFDSAVYDICSTPVDLLKSLSNVADIVAGPSDESALALPPSVADVVVPRSVFLMDYVPLWGYTSICGRRPEMEDAVVAVPRFFNIPLRMLTSELVIDGISPDAITLPAHFFGVYDGHGGAQVADYCRDRVHRALAEELTNVKDRLGSTQPDEWQRQWERALTDCFLKVDDEVGGKTSSVGGSVDGAAEEGSSGAEVPVEPIAPETVGSTAVVAVICSSHIVVANSGDSRAVLYRGKQPVPLSVDHKPNREDEYARIEAAGGKVIPWNGYRVFGVLAMSRSIGDRYLKPWIIPNPEVTIVPRAKEDECLILASDGLWDVMSNEEVCEAARRRILLWHKKNGVTASSSSSGEEPNPAAQAAADYLSKLAIQKGSKDNITVIVLDLKAHRKFKNKA